MAKSFFDTKQAKETRAYIVLKKGKMVARVLAAYPGTSCHVTVMQHGEAAERSAATYEKIHRTPVKVGRFESPMGTQTASAGGGGYDKFTAALSGMIIDGHAITNHCSRNGAPKPRKGMPCFPSDFKAPKGYSLSNWGAYSKSNPNAYYGPRGDWRDKAQADLGITDIHEGDNWDRICIRAQELKAEWEASDDCVKGYKDCYRLDGLKYLAAIGYDVITVI